MFARNVKWAALLLLAFAVYTSCSRHDELAGEDTRGEEIVTSVGVNVPELFMTRTAMLSDIYAGEGARYLGTSGMPSIGNVDLQEHPLTFTVGVYVKKKEGVEGFALVDKQSLTVTDDNAYFEFRLLKGQQYRLVAYADFNAEPKEDLESISFTTLLNDELSDAFFASEDFFATANVQVVLKRPFGKLRLVAHDFNTFAAGEAFKINKVTVNYYRSPMLATNTFNALTGDFNYDADSEGNHTVEAVPVVYTQEYTTEGKAPVDESGKEGPVTVFTMYLPANYGEGGALSADETPGLNPDLGHVDENAVPQSYYYPFDVTVEYENANGNKNSDETTVKTIERSFTIDIPVKRNWLTTVDVTNFWTDLSGVMVTVHAAFDGEIAVEEKERATVKTADELDAAINKIFQEAPDEVITKRLIVLGADIDATDRVGFNLYNLKANGSDRSKRGVYVYLDLNGHTITTNGEHYPNWVDENGEKHFTLGALFHVKGVNSRLYIDDTNKDKVGGLKFVGDASYAYPLVCSHNGGQVTINRGNFITSSPSEAIYVYESENHRAIVQLWVLSSLKIKPNSDAPKPTDEATLRNIESQVKSWSASVTINGGWYESAIDATTEDKYRIVINDYNAREAYWDRYKNYFPQNGYPDWTAWGEYVNQPFGFVYMNGGSFVEQDPSKGDNIVGNVPTKWIGDGHVQKEIINGKTVYTVIPKDVVNNF